MSYNNKYTLVEVARKYDVTPAYINKIVKETRVIKKSRKKGVQYLYSESDVHALNTVFTLRLLGYSLHEIVDIVKILKGNDLDAIDAFKRHAGRKALEIITLMEDFIHHQLQENNNERINFYCFSSKISKKTSKRN